MSAAPRRSRLLRIALILLLTLIALALGGCLLLDKPRPTGTAGAEADALARRMMDAVDVDAWQRTGAVQWVFAKRQTHLWDRQRGFARVAWGGEREVLLDLATRDGVATVRGQAVTDPTERGILLDAAWRHWVNDSFWLNPVAKLFDDGTERALVTDDDGIERLLITYNLGGVTPGDAYLWTPGDDGTPADWRMWTAILPIDGVKASWRDWIALDTGARVSTHHDIFFLDLVLSDVAGASDLATLLGPDAEDPFAALVAHLAQTR
ncbi:MAG: hypothetical protein AAF772_08710 [Acidobacteriota bacterium]